ncbi:J-domain-containing protein [Nocardioides bruguierae]|uniref:DnaJ family domain-containing protein n=1 Tax=Nocardioides bruguierae TaxID=2945102 RepID=UPI00202211BF|nr:DUF1992 domain-containing protein [Nocardioides bruguierae]MCL8023981.1 DUF1992 domain-containing protein [Nocardioides bruguierae]
MSQQQPHSEIQRARDEAERRKRSQESPAAARIANQASWVDEQLRVAMARGDFDDLPGAGKPIEDLGEQHDPDWWVKKLVEREQITGVLPPSLQLRKDDALLDRELDRLTVEAEVRRVIGEFNERVLRARYTVQDNQPPLVTQLRDVEATVQAWAQRRALRLEEARARVREGAATPPSSRPRWWRRRRGGKA